jgi:hypothetical protein
MKKENSSLHLILTIGNPTTYWASNAFIDSGVHNVLYDIDLGKNLGRLYFKNIQNNERHFLLGSPSIIDNIRIDWEYPAFE